MPTYDYKCSACGHEFELFQSMTAAPVKKCPSCGKAKAKRLIGTGAGLLFKGSGFYITDYRSESYNKSATADTSSSGSASSGGDSKGGESKSGDAKPAAEAKPAASSTNADKPAAKAAPKKSDGKK
ncbi:MAG TPA: zinc ribbon domain-containing protein [Tepidisphaeraceae bacterium]|nr:zinc ribbon domain-containing protein [Tepidisphaeraceae bacterium]